MLAIETAVASGTPQRTATGSTASSYRTPRLSTGTYGFRTAIAAVTNATAATELMTPTGSTRALTRRTVLRTQSSDLVATSSRPGRSLSLAVNADDQRNDQDRDDVRDLDHRVDRGA